MKRRICTIECLYCQAKNNIVIVRDVETICCLNCYGLLRINYQKDIVVTETHEVSGFGNRDAYLFVLLYFHLRYPETVHLLLWIDSVGQTHKGLMNPLLDITSKMIYGSKELCYLTETDVKLTALGMQTVDELFSGDESNN